MLLEGNCWGRKKKKQHELETKLNAINNKFFSYFKSLFERTDQIDKLNHNTLLQSITLPSVTNDQKDVCDNDLTDKELFDPWKEIPNNKSPRFWDELKGSFTNSIKLPYQKKALSTSQLQEVIKLIEKKIVIKHCWGIGDQFPYLM